MPKFLQFASITKKVTLAIIGIFLMLFLLVHLGINLCMLRDDGGAWFRAAAHFMGTNYIVKVFEIVLIGAILLHILLGLIIQIQNWMARPVRYASRSKSKVSPGSRLMIWTGSLIVVFLVLHFINFYFVKIGLVDGKYLVEIESLQHAIKDKQITLGEAYAQASSQEERQNIELEFSKMQDVVGKWEQNPKISEALQKDMSVVQDLTKAEIKEYFTGFEIETEPDFYNMARQLFKNIWAVLAYVVLLIAVGVHLNHAFQSSFQTLGLAHSKYTPVVKIIGTLYAIFITVGFIIIPTYFYFFG